MLKAVAVVTLTLAFVSFAGADTAPGSTGGAPPAGKHKKGTTSTTIDSYSWQTEATQVAPNKGGTSAKAGKVSLGGVNVSDPKAGATKVNCAGAHPPPICRAPPNTPH